MSIRDDQTRHTPSFVFTPNIPCHKVMSHFSGFLWFLEGKSLWESKHGHQRGMERWGDDQSLASMHSQRWLTPTAAWACVQSSMQWTQFWTTHKILSDVWCQRPAAGHSPPTRGTPASTATSKYAAISVSAWCLFPGKMWHIHRFALNDMLQWKWVSCVTRTAVLHMHSSMPEIFRSDSQKCNTGISFSHLLPFVF